MFARPIALMAALAAPPADDPTLTIRLVHPEVQGRRILDLFQGAPMPHPAAALAAYRRALMGNTGLSRGVEGVIAVFNPDMMAELATLDGATIQLRARPDGGVGWNALIPRDDGTFAAFATAAVLTDGGNMPPLDGLPVDRLGPRGGASLAAVAPEGFLLGSDRDELARARARSVAKADPPVVESGMVAGFDPRGLDAPGQPLSVRRLGVALAALGCRRFDATLAIEGETLGATVIGRFPGPRPSRPLAVERAWLDGIPARSTFLAFAVALDPSPEAWNAAFALLDRVEKADPAAVAAAPIRTRLDLLAAASGVRTDADLLGVLKGVAGVVTVDDKGQADGAILRLKARDAAAAERLRAATIPRLLATAGIQGSESEGVLHVGSIAIGRVGDSVDVSWGGKIRGLVADAEAKPDASERGWIARSPLTPTTQRFVVAWPGRLTKGALADLPPTFWAGRFEGETSVDRVVAPALKTFVRRMLEGLPFDPPPDVARPLPRREG